MHASEVAAAAGEPSRVAARGPDQLAIADPVPAGGGQHVCGGIDRHHALPTQQRNVPIRPEAGGPDQDALERLFGREILLGERGPLVRRRRIVADDRDRAVESLLSQRNRRLRTTMPRADDDDLVGHHRHAPAHALSNCRPPPANSPISVPIETKANPCSARIRASAASSAKIPAGLPAARIRSNAPSIAA